jgi:isopentenyl phosphate kinase
MENIILVKLGGSLVTDKSREFTPRLSAIKRLAEEIAQARKRRKIALVVGNGAGSFAHTPARKYKTHKGIVNKESTRGFAVVQDAAAKLNRIVVSALINAGEKAISINPSSAVIAKNGKIKEFYLKPLEEFLKLSIIPVVYGDVVVDTKMGCSIISTEKLLNFIALDLVKKGYRIENLVHYGTTSGVLDKNGETIPKISSKNFNKFVGVIKGSKGIDVTGGMLHKVQEALLLAKRGIPSYIMNGFEKEYLKKVILGKKVQGTLIDSC